MCKPMSEGGARCPAHHYGTMSAKRIVAAALPKMPEQQVNYSFSRLRRSADRDLSAPTLEEYQRWLNRQMVRWTSDDAKVKLNQRARRSVKNSIQRALDNAESQLPDAATFDAMKRMVSTNADDWRTIHSKVTELAKTNRVKPTAVYNEFMENLKAGPRVSNGAYETELSPRITQALDLTSEGVALTREDTPRVEHTDLPEGGLIGSYGYDPDGGRLEVVDSHGRLFSFHSVTQQDVDALLTTPAPVLSKLSRSAAHQYEDDDDAKADAYRIWCERCDRFHRNAPCDAPDDRQPLPMGHDIDSLYRRVLDHFNNTNQDSEHYLPPPVWEDADHDYGEPVALEVEYGTEPGAHRRGGTTNSTRVALTDEVFEKVREHMRRREPVIVELGRNIAVRGSGGTQFHHVRVPVTLTPYMGNVTWNRNHDLSDARCDCPEYQSNGRCRHLYVNDDSDELNELVQIDLNRGMQELDRAGRIPPDVSVAVEYDRDSRQLVFTEDDLNDIGNAIRSQLSYSIQYRDENGSIMAMSAVRNSNPRDLSGFGGNTELLRSTRGRLQEEFGWLAAERNAEVVRENMREGWENNPDERGDYYRRFGAEDETSYFSDPQLFLDDYRDAERRRQEGGELEVRREPVTNGFISSVPGEGRGFGIELEFEGGHNVQEAVAAALHREELSDAPFAAEYHSSSYETWVVEDDCSVGGEVVSPILYDTPECWAQVEKVCKIIKDNGGRVSVNAGGHVHIGINDENRRETIYGTFAATTAHQDVIRRLSTDPARGEHRNRINSYTNPFTSRDVESAYASPDEAAYLDRYKMMNFGNYETIEFRDPDGSLDPGHIQTQVMMAAALVRTGEQGDWSAMDARSNKVQRVGANATRDQYITEAIEDEDERILASNVSLISTLDTLFPDRRDRQQMLDVAVRNPWQRPAR